MSEDGASHPARDADFDAARGPDPLQSQNDDAPARGAQEKEEPRLETRIDVAFVAAGASGADDAAEADARAARFIELLLSEPLFCPVWEPEEGEEAETLRPMMIEEEGRDTVLLFDSEERLSRYMREPAEFVAAPGRAFFESAAEHGVQIALNWTVAPSSTLFTAETVEAVAALATAAEDDEALPGDAAIVIEAPKFGGGDEADEALLSALTARVAAARPLVREAWLFTVRASRGEDEEIGGGELVLGLAPTDEARASASDALQGLARELSRLGAALMNAGARAGASSLLDGDAPLSVALFEPGDRVLSAARRHGFGLMAQDAA